MDSKTDKYFLPLGPYTESPLGFWLRSNFAKIRCRKLMEVHMPALHKEP